MIARVFILVSMLLVSFQSAAAYYYLTNYNWPNRYPLPPCTGNWDINGSKYECDGSLTLQSGDEIIAYNTSKLEVKNNIYFESNIIGNPNFSGISVKSTDGHLRIIDTVIYGAAEAKQSIVINEYANGSYNSNHYSFILGKVKSSDSTIRMINTDVRGDVDAKQSVNINVRSNGAFAASRASIIEGKIKSHDSSIRVVDARIDDDVDAKQSININVLSNESYVFNSHVSVGGKVKSSDNSIRIINASIADDVDAKQSVNINELSNGAYVPNSDVSVGGKVKSSDNSIRILNATVTDEVDAKLSVNINVLNNGTYATNTRTEVGGGVVSHDDSIRMVSVDVRDNVVAKKEIDINRLSNGVDVPSTASDIAGDIDSTENNIVLGMTTRVVGDITAGPKDKGTVFVNSGSTVDGVCLYQTVPENACGSEVTLPDAVALYHLDETSWNGSNNEIVDSSGNQLHGRAVNGLTAKPSSDFSAIPTINSLGTCGFGGFNNNSNQYINIPHNNNLNIDKNLTISAWVKPVSYPRSGLHSILSKDNNYEFHLNSSGKIFWWWQDKNKNGNGNVQTRTLTSEVSIPINKWSFITLRYDSESYSNNKSLASIFINGEEKGELLINANRKLVNNAKPLQIGQDQNFSGRAFDGYIDEIQIFDKPFNNNQILHLYNQTHLCSDMPDNSIDHFELEHSGSELTCNAEEVAIRACANESCSELVTGDIDVTLSPAAVAGGGGWVGGNQIQLSGGTGIYSVRKNIAGNLNIGVISSEPTVKPGGEILCSSAGGELGSGNCSIEFYESGFVLEVPDKIAGRAVTGRIKAVKSSDDAQKCLPSFQNTSKNLEFFGKYITPDSSVIIGSPTIGLKVGSVEQDLAMSSSSLKVFAVDFDNNGEAEFDVNYIDAGKLQLNAQYEGSDDELGLDMRGAAQFVSFPKQFNVQARNITGSSGSCITGDLTCAVFAKAGEAFTLNIWTSGDTGVVTPNFSAQDIALSHELKAPIVTGTESGLLGNASYSHIAISSGINSVAQSVSEVGVFNFLVEELPSYLGSNSFTVQGAQTGSVGRFTPYYLHLNGNTPSFTEACSPFTYLGQAMEFSSLPELTVTGRSFDNVGSNGDQETLNYKIDGWWRYANPWNFRTFGAESSTLSIIDNDPSKVVQTQGFAWPGQVTFDSKLQLASLEDAHIAYVKPLTPLGPINEGVIVRLAVDDTRDLDGVCYQTNGSASCTGFDLPVSDSQRQRWGYLAIADTFGPETSRVQSAVTSYYFDGSSFKTNASDSCSDFSVVGLSFDVGNDSNALPIGGGVTAATIDTTPIIQNGEGYISYSAPGEGNRGALESTLGFESFPWLRNDYNQDGIFDDTIVSEVRFGLYRGSDRVIWWSEQN
ncbi:LamG domain-containing protein [Vibrio splendidus]|uniref:LamG domain-containing protein n=1 Tax=Vibrio splendidus TaxID=29497 RepID=A0A7Y4D6U7_VIBSP|nr:LamG domain-containing protein [Vibrio splendidus]NOJ13404.1 LamG domain-containing protein [Vibrio splendidus]